jgi:hypothetical protein
MLIAVSWYPVSRSPALDQPKMVRLSDLRNGTALRPDAEGPKEAKWVFGKS